jgi:hypothetical protein
MEFILNEQERDILVVLLEETIKKETLSNTTKLIYENLIITLTK